MKLRPYQQQARERIIDELSRVNGTLIVMATGSGKTALVSTIAKDWANLCTTRPRVLMVAQNREIVIQNAKTLELVTGEPVGIEMAESRARQDGFLPRIVSATVQTLRSITRCVSLEPDSVGLLVIDEAHHSDARSYRALFKKFPHAKRLLVTATPDAISKRKGDLYDTLAFEYGIKDGIRDGYLCPIRQQIKVITELKLDDLRTVRGDLDQEQLAYLMERDRNVFEVATATMDDVGNRPTLVFAASVKHAHAMAGVFNATVFDSAVAMDANTPKGDRERDLKRFANGEFQYLCNFGLFLEGWDAIPVAAVAMARPTKSRSLYAQAIGRGTRTCESCRTYGYHPNCPVCLGKKDLLVLDFEGQSRKHKLVSAIDLLAEDIPAKTLKKARELAQRMSTPPDVQELIAQAAAMDAEVERKLREKLRFQAEHYGIDVDPFAPPQEVELESGKKVRMPSFKQILWLKQRNLYTEGMTAGEAGRIIGSYKEQRRSNKWSPKQEEYLRKLGYSGAALTPSQASAMIDTIKSQSPR